MSSDLKLVWFEPFFFFVVKICTFNPQHVDKGSGQRDALSDRRPPWLHQWKTSSGWREMSRQEMPKCPTSPVPRGGKYSCARASHDQHPTPRLYLSVSSASCWVKSSGWPEPSPATLPSSEILYQMILSLLYDSYRASSRATIMGHSLLFDFTEPPCSDALLSCWLFYRRCHVNVLTAADDTLAIR